MFKEKFRKKVEEDSSFEWLTKITRNDGIVVVPPDTEKYLNDNNQISVVDSINKTISKQLLIDIISDDYSFEILRNVFGGKGHFFSIILTEENGKLLDQFILGKIPFAKLLCEINTKEDPSLSDRYNQLIKYVSFDRYKERTQDLFYRIKMDGKYYEIPIKLIHQFIELDDEEFNKLLSDSNTFNDMALPYFAYAVKNYFYTNGIMNKYLVSNKIEERLEMIKSSKIIDIQMINDYLYTDDEYLDYINVNKELENFILNDIPDSFNDLEKAIYIYIKMCKTFTYDDEFFAVNELGPLTEKHQLIDNISNITPTNNKIVCYEFNMIYAHLLNKLGINYKKYVNTKHGESLFEMGYHKYSEGHTFLKFRWGKYLVKADSVDTILHGDIMQAKLNQPLNGLICENINEKSKEDFSHIMTKVYKYIAEREEKISGNEVEEIESFDDIVSKFVSSTDKIRPIDIHEKLNILINKINSTKMVGIDAFSYLLQLKKILFSEEEIENNIKITIIKKEEENSAEALAIISIILPDENGNMITNRYIYKPGQDLIPISQEDLQEEFNNNRMGYIRSDDPIIPGIKR